MAAKVYKINIFTNNFATTYARNINNMSIFMFSGVRKPIFSFVLEKNIVQSWFLQIWAKTTGYRSETVANIVWLIVLFLFWLCLAASPMVISGRMWSSHPCGCFVKHEFQHGCHEITDVIFSIIFLSGTTIEQILPSFDIIILPKCFDKLYYIYSQVNYIPAHMHYRLCV